MPVFSELALHALARTLRTPGGARAVRQGFAALLDTDAPPVMVERLARRRPDVGLPPSSDAISFAASAGTATSGPLAGERVVVKDSFDVAGLPSTLGVGREGEIAAEDAELVARIRAAGGTVVGKGVMTELGIDGLGTLVAGGLRQNGVVPGYVPGGSSTGVAMAVALANARYGLGGDGLGSVRIPSALHGLVGLKPGRDVLSQRGYASVAPAIDVPGPMARTTADTARLFQVLAGLPLRPIEARAPRRVGLVRGLDAQLATRDLRVAFDRALDLLSVERRELEIDGARAHGLVAVGAATSEAAVANGHWLDRARSGQAQVIAAVGRALAGERDEIVRRSALLREACLRALESVDVLAMPTTAIPAPALRRGHARGGFEPLAIRALGTFTPIANVTGLPAIAMPSGRDARGRPLSVMFLGPPGSEETLLAAAAALEATGVGARAVPAP